MDWTVSAQRGRSGSPRLRRWVRINWSVPSKLEVILQDSNAPKPRVGHGIIAKQRHTIEEGLARMSQSTNPGEEQVMADITTLSLLELKTLILEGNKAITKKIDGVAMTVVLMRQELAKMREKVKDLGTRTTGLKDNVTAHTSQLTDYER
ncbi:hypothetical protein NDU88_001271 [Pleurodeles waltl]|uniref:Uncharacterized protein n=1 Tax=Pleurodeles waltl TaxID=8319 RepID=A0AAV7VAH4_PLEWA|nr:hypothetical protein NDU88_001271 [Pleurodeles waltl]